MRLALPGSALVHAGAVSLLFVGFVWPEAQDAAAPAPVTVNIIPLSNVASNATEVLQTSNTVSSLTAGGPEPIEETPREMLEPVSDTLDRTEPEQVEPLEQGRLEPVEAEALDAQELSTAASSDLSVRPVAPLEAAPQEVLEVASIAPTTPTQSIDPVETQTLVTPPAMPTPVSQRPPDRPKSREEPRQPAPEPRPKPAAPAGNGGNSSADSIASAGGAQPQQSDAGNGGEADVARYPSQVIGKLRNAMRRGGDRGEMIVRFTVGAGGDLQGVSVARSSGSAAVDAAGTALVQRAAPFPPIPAAASRNSWTFDVPLAFGG